MLKKLLSTKGRFLISGAPEGGDAMILGDAVHQAPGRLLLHIARDDARMARLAEAINFFHPEIDCLQFPAWDCLPYDRVSPNGTIVSQRMEVLSRLAHSGSTSGPAGGGDRLVITTVNAVLQRTPPRETLNGARLEITRSGRMPLDSLVGFLERHGYIRSGTVTEPGDYAPRGGLVDIFPPGAAAPLRIDLFGDQVDSIRVFDPLTQRSAESVERLMLTMVTEFRLDEESVARFREGYRELFGATMSDDPLYEAVCAGRRHIGMEHWLPLFHDRMETLFDYVGGAPVSLDPLLDNARESRLSAIADYYGTRRQAASRAKELVEGVYRPLPPERLYLDEAEWAAYLAPRAVAEIIPFNAPGSDATPLFDAGGRPSRDFAAERADPDANLFDAVGGYIERELGRGRRLLVACYSEGSLDRLAGLLADHGVEQVARPDDWAASRDLPQGVAALVVLGLDHGFETDALVVLSEQDILGDRLARRQRRARRVEDFIAEASQLEIGDIVVHIDHGIGRFDGLETIELSGARHDCLRLYYDGDDKLYLPVENIEALSRYGSSDSVVQLDRLGGLQWQARKARLKERIKEMAGELLRVAAERRLRPGEKMAPPEGLYDEFCARFPYMETEDQSRSIEDVIGDLASGRPMDRLICGDVGFGKTEVAMRAAFIVVMEGRQVAVVVPTTLLCRQHFATFSERFQGLPVRIAQLSRLVAGKRAVEVKQGMANGQVDIVIGTHALLGKSIAFKRLGLLVIDEEQHFGVAHKERLKQMRADVHVLTLTATPIPRTMQMALTGVRELSLMATPPLDRLAVRSFIMPYDPVVVREAILREHFRGGQSFFVCPRIEDIGPIAAHLAELVPEVRIAIAHGRLAPRHLENVMTAFYDRAYDVLISTAIIESGLDIPSVNTMIVYRAHMFGLSQLYQLRGRIGRSKLRAYAYFTLPPHGGLTNAATKRLEVLHKLDSLGAGFSLASHDLDIRGAGNLLGSEQSGHIREVGLELFQHMLEEAVRAARAAGEGGEGTEKGAAETTVKDWTPQINVGAAVLIPEDYVADLGVRLALYRRLALLESGVEVEAFAAELIDRFGPLPVLVENLLEVMTIKRLCRDAGVARVEAGDTGAVLSFHDDRFANPAGLAAFIGRQSVGVRLRPDHSLLIPGDWAQADARLKGVREILASIAEIAKAAG